MKRSLVIVGYGLGGVLVAMLLSWGAFALAGRQIGEPATPVRPAFSLSASPTATEAPSTEPDDTLSPGPEPSDTMSPSQNGSPSSDGGSGSDDHPSGGHHGGEDD
jgi:hypothetical protein